VLPAGCKTPDGYGLLSVDWNVRPLFCDAVKGVDCE
jgi:hypothetical protein